MRMHVRMHAYVVCVCVRACICVVWCGMCVHVYVCMCVLTNVQTVPSSQ